MIEIIDILRGGNFYNCGKFTEIAKGKNEMITTFYKFKRKLNRLWLSRKK